MSGPSAIGPEIAALLQPHGLFLRGIAVFRPGEGPLLESGMAARSVALIGNIGGSMWSPFSGWRKSHAGADPLDDWSKAVIRPVAEHFGATAFFPSDPPWQPFQQWAMKAEGLRPSPLGILIHPEFGLWHGYRGALAFPFELETEKPAPRYPCDRCEEKPCLDACPVHAVRLDGFEVAACRSYLDSEAGRESCMAGGCAARNACPVGAQYRYPLAQLKFHMEALMG